MSGPSNAEQAQTAVASARAATLTTYPRMARPALTLVSVRADAGTLVLRLHPSSPAAADLGQRPLGTVRVSPTDCATVTIQGKVHRLPAQDTAGLLAFRLDVGAVRLGQQAATVVDVQDYRAAEPDPLRADAPAILAHLRQSHGEQLAGCLRAHGHTAARWADARRLDRYGLELGVLEDGGVSTARLDFGTPVGSVNQLGPGLSVVLTGSRCGYCPPRSPL